MTATVLGHPTRCACTSCHARQLDRDDLLHLIDQLTATNAQLEGRLADRANRYTLAWQDGYQAALDDAHMDDDRTGCPTCDGTGTDLGSDDLCDDCGGTG